MIGIRRNARRLLSAVVIKVCERSVDRGTQHGQPRFFLASAMSQRRMAGSAAAEKSAERARFFSPSNHALQKWNEFFPKRLMELIGECASQAGILTRDANAAVIAQALAQVSAAPVRPTRDGKILLAADVLTSKSGIKRTKYSDGETSKR